jgi:hypothetical protein
VNNLMGWRFSCGSVPDPASATDGDLDVMLALIAGYCQWTGTSWTERPTGNFWRPDISQLGVRNIVSGPKDFMLSGNYPNPFNPSAAIKYSPGFPSQVRLDIFNLLGQKKRTLIDCRQDAGEDSVSWNGYDENGDQSGSEVYFYRLTTGNCYAQKKMLLVRSKQLHKDRVVRTRPVRNGLKFPYILSIFQIQVADIQGLIFYFPPGWRNWQTR